MSEEISRQIEDAAAARSREAASRTDSSQLADLIVAGATRRRRVRGFATAAFAAVGVLAIAGGTVAAMAAWGPGAVAPATQSVTLPVVETSMPWTSASPSPSASAAVETGGLDGITDYPALAPARGEGFPSAYVMEDWVWDHVGPGWSLATYSMEWNPYAEPTPLIPNAFIYLVSPDGATFELFGLDHKDSAGLRVVAWHEDERMAVVWWEGDDVDPGDAAWLDLSTGAIDPLDFTMPGKVHSTVETPIAIAADGTELWQASAPGVAERFYRWSHADGWTVAAVNDLPGLGTATGFDVAVSGFPGRPVATRDDGAAVVFARFAEGKSIYQQDPPVELAVYDLARDVVTRTMVSVDAPRVYFTGWSAAGTVEFEAFDKDGAPLPPVTVPVAGAPSQGPVPSVISTGAGRGVTGESAVVRFGEAISNDFLYRECGC